MSAPLKAWPRRPGCIGPWSAACWNPLSVLQVDTLFEAAAEGMRPADMAAVTDAELEDVEAFIARNGLNTVRMP